MDFVGIGGWEVFLVIALVVILFGPGKIVNTARTLGKIVHSLKKMTSELTIEVAKEVDAQEKKKDAPVDLYEDKSSQDGKL